MTGFNLKDCWNCGQILADKKKFEMQNRKVFHFSRSWVFGHLGPVWQHWATDYRAQTLSQCGGVKSCKFMMQPLGVDYKSESIPIDYHSGLYWQVPLYCQHREGEFFYNSLKITYNYGHVNVIDLLFNLSCLIMMLTGRITSSHPQLNIMRFYPCIWKHTFVRPHMSI